MVLGQRLALEPVLEGRLVDQQVGPSGCELEGRAAAGVPEKEIFIGGGEEKEVLSPFVAAVEADAFSPPPPSETSLSSCSTISPKECAQWKTRTGSSLPKPRRDIARETRGGRNEEDPFVAAPASAAAAAAVSRSLAAAMMSPLSKNS